MYRRGKHLLMRTSRPLGILWTIGGQDVQLDELCYAERYKDILQNAN